MPREDRAKLSEWRERLTRFDQSEKTVSDFCSGERVSVATFYYWKKKLSMRENAVNSLQRSTQKALPSRVSSNAGRRSHSATGNGVGKELERQSSPRSNRRAFQPVEITVFHTVRWQLSGARSEDRRTRRRKVEGRRNQTTTTGLKECLDCGQDANLIWHFGSDTIITNWRCVPSIQKVV